MIKETCRLVNRITGNCDAFINYLELMRDMSLDNEEYCEDVADLIKLICLIKLTANDVANELLNIAE